MGHWPLVAPPIGASEAHLGERSLSEPQNSIHEHRPSVLLRLPAEFVRYRVGGHEEVQLDTNILDLHHHALDVAVLFNAETSVEGKTNSPDDAPVGELLRYPPHLSLGKEDGAGIGLQGSVAFVQYPTIGLDRERAGVRREA